MAFVLFIHSFREHGEEVSGPRRSLRPNRGQGRAAQEEASADEIVQQLEMVQDSKGGMFMLDRELGSRALPALGAEVQGISAGE